MRFLLAVGLFGVLGATVADASDCKKIEKSKLVDGLKSVLARSTDVRAEQFLRFTQGDGEATAYLYISGRLGIYGVESIKARARIECINGAWHLEMIGWGRSSDGNEYGQKWIDMGKPIRLY